MKADEKEIRAILAEDARRLKRINAVFNPITGEGSTGKRVKLAIPDFPIPVQYIPREMAREPLVRQLKKAGSVEKLLDLLGSETENRAVDREKVLRRFIDTRMLHDFPFWCAYLVYIKNKGGGDDVLFRLNRPQRRFAERLESLRLAGKPIRLILLKARQWGGSTLSQIYMAWLQLVHRKGLNSLIIAHQGLASDEIRDMFDRLISAYPLEMLHPPGTAYSPAEPKLVGVGKSGGIHRVPQRNCKIKIGTAERPDSCRGGDYNLVHLSEVAYWKETEGKKPEDIVRSACSGVLLEPYTMIVYESTANGTANFYHREYQDAKRGISQFEAMFIAWFDIDIYSMEIKDRAAFARTLWENRNNRNETSDRGEPGCYLWSLWRKGATLEAIAWYVEERRKHASHSGMASEYPSDDIEAFQHSGQRVFDIYQVEALRPSCCAPKFVGEVYGRADEGEDALQGLKFREDRQGLFWIWEKPEEDSPTERITDRYLAVVDVGGRSGKADWSVVVVFDRLFQMDGGQPEVVAQWYGHCDIDLLAWRAAQIAAYYNNALLVIESNTLETRDRERDTEGDQSSFILNQIKDVYPNLYARRQSEADIRQGLPRRYGFHTNIATKPMIISTLVKVIREGLYVERDERCVDEYLCYEKKRNGAFGAIEGKHDDLLMTRAIGLHISFFEMEPPRVVPLMKQQPHSRRPVTAATI